MSTTPDFAATQWRKSSYSNGGDANCVEVADGIPHVVPVRDSKAPERRPLTFPPAQWQAFIQSL